MCLTQRISVRSKSEKQFVSLRESVRCLTQRIRVIVSLRESVCCLSWSHSEKQWISKVIVANWNKWFLNARVDNFDSARCDVADFIPHNSSLQEATDQFKHVAPPPPAFDLSTYAQAAVIATNWHCLFCSAATSCLLTPMQDQETPCIGLPFCLKDNKYN